MQPFNDHYPEHTAATNQPHLPSPRLRVRHCISRNSLYIKRTKYDFCRPVVCVSQPSLTAKLPVHQCIALQSHSTLLLKKYKINLILIQTSAPKHEWSPCGIKADSFSFATRPSLLVSFAMRVPRYLWPLGFLFAKIPGISTNMFNLYSIRGIQFTFPSRLYVPSPSHGIVIPMGQRWWTCGSTMSPSVSAAPALCQIRGRRRNGTFSFHSSFLYK